MNGTEEAAYRAGYEAGVRAGAGLTVEVATVLFRAVRWHRGDEDIVPLRRAVAKYLEAKKQIEQAVKRDDS